VQKGEAASHQRLDELYREHPERFVARRNQLAKDLRAAGDRDGAQRTKKLRRPTVAAWLVNLAALSSPAQVEEFSEASRALEAAQARALEGKDEAGTGWRAAAEREREAAAAILEIAESAAREAGHLPSPRALELVGETLRAATADPELRERVLQGRVEREQSAATLGTPPAAGARRRRDRGSAKRRDAAQARRELERLEEELGDAREREERLSATVERTAETLRREKARLAEAKREAAGLRRRLKTAERRSRN
jgi:hypothetical protein